MQKKDGQYKEEKGPNERVKGEKGKKKIIKGSRRQRKGERRRADKESIERRGFTGISSKKMKSPWFWGGTEKRGG